MSKCGGKYSTFEMVTWYALRKAFSRQVCIAQIFDLICWWWQEIFQVWMGQKQRKLLFKHSFETCILRGFQTWIEFKKLRKWLENKIQVLEAKVLKAQRMGAFRAFARFERKCFRDVANSTQYISCDRIFRFKAFTVYTMKFQNLRCLTWSEIRSENKGA